jgi:ribosome recycling factor
MLAQELAKLRTGRASPALLDGVKVDYYGSTLPLKQVATVSIPEPRLIIIQPWDKTNLGEIEKAIHKSAIGLTPDNDGNVIRLSIPPLTTERREELVKLTQKLGEDIKVAIRNVRREANTEIKKEEKNKNISEDTSFQTQEEVQKEKEIRET